MRTTAEQTMGTRVTDPKTCRLQWWQTWDRGQHASTLETWGRIALLLLMCPPDRSVHAVSSMKFQAFLPQLHSLSVILFSFKVNVINALTFFFFLWTTEFYEDPELFFVVVVELLWTFRGVQSFLIFHPMIISRFVLCFLKSVTRMCVCIIDTLKNNRRKLSLVQWTFKLRVRLACL